MGTKVTITFLNKITGVEVTKIYHATGTVAKDATTGDKTFTGHREGETTNGSMTVHTKLADFPEIDQKDESE